MRFCGLQLFDNMKYLASICAPRSWRAMEHKMSCERTYIRVCMCRLGLKQNWYKNRENLKLFGQIRVKRHAEFYDRNSCQLELQKKQLGVGAINLWSYLNDTTSKFSFPHASKLHTTCQFSSVLHLILNDFTKLYRSEYDLVLTRSNRLLAVFKTHKGTPTAVLSWW